MARAAGSKDYMSLAAGLVTEASDLAFPDGATSDEVNFVLDSGGQKRVKRKGLKAAESLVYSETDPEGDDEYKIGDVTYWREPDVYVVPYVANIGGSPATVRINFHRGSDFSYIDRVSISDPNFEEGLVVNTAIIEDMMVIMTGKAYEQIVCEYDPSGNTIEVYGFNFYIRDFELVDDGFSVTDRPGVDDDDHRYNLYNAGWYADRRDDADGQFKDPVDLFYADSGNTSYPSNADIPQLGVKTDANGNEVFDKATLDETPIGSTEAPRGHYVYELSDTDRTNRLNNRFVSGVPGSTTNTSPFATITL